MKRLLCITACLLVTGMSFAQTDSTSKNTDTLTVGNFTIIKKAGDANDAVTERRRIVINDGYRIENLGRLVEIDAHSWREDFGFAAVMTATHNFLQTIFSRSFGRSFGRHFRHSVAPGRRVYIRIPRRSIRIIV